MYASVHTELYLSVSELLVKSAEFYPFGGTENIY